MATSNRWWRLSETVAALAVFGLPLVALGVDAIQSLMVNPSLVHLAIPSGRTLVLLAHSCALAGATAVLCLVAGTAASLALPPASGRMGWLRTALFVPMVIPSYVHALAWMRAAEWLRRVVAVAGIRLPAFQGFGAALWVQAIVSTGTGLPHNNVVSIRQMSDGTVWVGTGIVDQGGAVQLRRGADGVWRVIRTLDQAGGLAGNKARSIYVTRSGALIVGSEYEGMVVQTLQGFRVLTMDDGLSSDEVKSMVEDAQGNLWCATRDGLTVIDRETLNAIERGEL